MRLRAIPLLSLMFAVAIGAGIAYAQATTNVQIDTLAIVGNTLTIKGRNFGASAPTVLVGQSTAAITSSSDTEIVAETPALAAGTHLVKVTRDSGEGGSAMSTLRVQ